MDELRLCLVTDRHQTRGRDLVSLVGDCVAAGLPSVQVREKDLGAAALAALCRRLQAVTLPGLIIVNDRVDVALAIGAGGMQRSSTSLSVRDVRQIVKTSLYIGASVHSLEESIEAEAEGADWLTFGPVYDTPSKRGYGAPQGLIALERVARAVTIPVIAIGGITPERVAEVRAAGAHGVAAISAILSAESASEAVRRFLDALEQTKR
ncbi:MAG: thiamine phosphate synthase [Candidatus Rokuibacteriota bacterium]